MILSVVKKTHSPPSLFVQFGDGFQRLEYGYNRAYPLRYMKYAGVYAAFLIFMLLTLKFQRDQIRRNAVAALELVPVSTTKARLIQTLFGPGDRPSVEVLCPIRYEEHLALVR